MSAASAVAHVGITVADLEASILFWRDALGFKLVLRSALRPPHAEAVTGVVGADIEVAILRLDACSVELLQYLAPAGRRTDARPCDVGAAHIALVVADVADVVAICRGHGWVPQGPSHTVEAGPGAGWQAVYLRDADGTTLELLGPVS